MYSPNSTTTSDRTFLKASQFCPNCHYQIPVPLELSNLYLDRFASTGGLNNTSMTFNPRKNIFMQTSPSRPELTYSAQKLNITFGYLSPIRIKGYHHSSESRFSTKKYKEKKFPHLKKREESDEPVLQIWKKIGK
jgi:hypothetical protein